MADDKGEGSPHQGKSFSRGFRTGIRLMVTALQSENREAMESLIRISQQPDGHNQKGAASCPTES